MVWSHSFMCTHILPSSPSPPAPPCTAGPVAPSVSLSLSLSLSLALSQQLILFLLYLIHLNIDMYLCFISALRFLMNALIV